jgi:hypothetical protein
MKHTKEHCQYFRIDEIQGQGKSSREFWHKRVITSKNCWCASTMKVFGPDKYPVTPERCMALRSCFKAPE